MSLREYNREPDFNAYRKNALYSLQQIASEANILPKQKDLIIRPKKKIVIESPYFSLEHPSSPQQDHPQPSLLQQYFSLEHPPSPQQDQPQPSLLQQYFSLEHPPSPQQDHPQPSLLQQSVILNSIKDIDWPNEDDGWIFIKNADNGDNEGETGVKREGESDVLQSYEILRKGGESVEGYNGKRVIEQHDSKNSKENQVSNSKHHLEDDDVYLFL